MKHNKRSPQGFLRKPRGENVYPEGICQDCGINYGQWHEGGIYRGPEHHCATYYLGACGICGKEDAITEPRDYGHLVRNWRDLYLRACTNTD